MKGEIIVKKVLLRVICATILGVTTINYSGVLQTNAVSSTKIVQKEVANEDDFELTLYQNPGSEMQAIIYGYKGNSENLEIPSKLQGGTVVAIGSEAFDNCSNLRTVKLPSTVKSIGDNSFSNCFNLKSITLSNSLENIGYGAFANCENLSEIDIPNTVTDIDRWAFSNCNKLNSITIPDSVTYLGSDTFNGCTNLKSVAISQNLLSIENETFYNCTSLKSVIIPRNIKEISNNAFSNCSALSTVTISDNLENVSYNAFEKCNIKEIIISQNSTSVKEEMIVSKGILKVTIPDSVTSIGDDAFYNCDSLKNATIPDSVTYIGSGAFCFCENLTDITIPNGVTYIGSSAFAGTGITNIVIPDSVTKLEGGVFCNCKKLETVKLPKTLTKIPDSMFAECYKLENVNIPNTVTKIDTQAFQNCKKLSKVNLPPTLKEIGIYAFNGCTSLKNIDMPDNLKIIGAMSFCDCNLSQIHLPKSVTEIQEYALGYNDLYPDSIYFEPSKIKNFKIYGYKGTVAETYAKKNGLIFVEPGNNISTPSVSSLTNTTGGIKLAWKKVDGAYGYRVYQKTSNGWKRIKDTTATSFTDSAVSANQTKTYTIRCIDKNGKTISGYNSKGWSKKYTPVAPTVSKLENTTGGIKLSWNKITGVYGYRVYAKTSSGWKKLKDTTATNLTDSIVSANQTKTYTIRCIDKNGKTVSGFYSKGWSKKYTATTPKITKLTNTSKGVSVTWNKIAGVYGYRLYYKTSSGGWKRIKDTTATSYTDSAVSANQTKTYTIRCIDKNGKTVSGFNSKGWSKKYTAATPKITKLTNRSKGVSVTWNKIAGVYGYRLYRKYAGGSWTKVKDTTSTSFTDSGAKKGKKVTYTVRCIDRKGKTVSGFNSKGWSITRK